MATIRFPTIIVFYLSEFRGSEGSLRYHVRGFEIVKELHESILSTRRTIWSSLCQNVLPVECTFNEM